MSIRRSLSSEGFFKLKENKQLDVFQMLKSQKIPFVPRMLSLYFYSAFYLVQYCCSFKSGLWTLLMLFTWNVKSNSCLKSNLMKRALIFHTDAFILIVILSFYAVHRGSGSSTLKESATCFAEWVASVCKRDGLHDGILWCWWCSPPPLPP